MDAGTHSIAQRRVDLPLSGNQIVSLKNTRHQHDVIVSATTCRACVSSVLGAVVANFEMLRRKRAAQGGFQPHDGAHDISDRIR
jgi:hypothetical protein